MGEGRATPGRVTVRTRILATMLVVTALGMTAAGLVAYQAQRAFVLQEIDEALRTQLEIARTTTADESVGSVREALQRILAQTVAPSDGGAIGLVDGELAYLPGFAETFQPAEVPGFLATVNGDDATRIDSFDREGPSLRYLAVPIRMAGDPALGMYVVAIDVEARLAGVARSATLYVAVSGAVLVLTAGLGWFVAGRLLAPVRRLREAAERITVNSLGERIPVDGTDDVSRLTATVNRMLDRIGDGIAQQRSLLADLRHELRAPLTLIRGHLEIVDESDPSDVRSVREVTLDEVDRMTRMIDELARLVESGLPAVDRVTRDTAVLARDLLARVRGIPGHEWLLGRVDAVTVSIDEDRVLEAWLQLADNAARYSPAGAPITLESVADAETVRLIVRDRGPGVPEGERDLIFRRGERGTAAEGTRGSGLGLAIVAAIARAHGGSTEVRAAAGGGAEFALVLPRAGEATSR